MPPNLFALAIAALLPLLAGCIDRTETITLNPDGSGKTRLDVLFEAPRVGLPKKPLEELKSILGSAKGVDAWTDVSYVVENDGRGHFQGTAYFKKISALSIMNVGEIDASFTANPDGSMTLLASTPRIPSRDARPAPDAPPVDDREIASRIAQVRQNWKLGRRFIAPKYAELKIHETFILPGKTAKSNILTPVPDGQGLQLAVDGKKITEGMDKFVTDDAALKAACAANRLQGWTGDDKLMCQWLFDKDAPISATVSGPFQPQFDYPAEAAAARAAEPGMFARLGLASDRTTDAPPLDRPVVPKPVP